MTGISEKRDVWLNKKRGKHASKGDDDLQGKIYKFLNNLFRYWCKKHDSKYLRISNFNLNMVIFGLAPNSQFIEKVIEEFSEKIELLKIEKEIRVL